MLMGFSGWHEANLTSCQAFRIEVEDAEECDTVADMSCLEGLIMCKLCCPQLCSRGSHVKTLIRLLHSGFKDSKQ